MVQQKILWEAMHCDWNHMQSGLVPFRAPGLSLWLFRAAAASPSGPWPVAVLVTRCAAASCTVH